MAGSFLRVAGAAAHPCSISAAILLRRARVEKWQVPMELMPKPHDGWSAKGATSKSGTRVEGRSYDGKLCCPCIIVMAPCAGPSHASLAIGGKGWTLPDRAWEREMASPDTTGELRNAVLAALDADEPLAERLAAIAARTRKERPEFAAAI